MKQIKVTKSLKRFDNSSFRLVSKVCGDPQVVGECLKKCLHFILYLRCFPVETVVVILAYLGLGSLSSWLPVLLVLLGLRSLESSSLESSLKASAALKNHRSGH